MATLVIFCKRPLPGQGKQRIARTLGKEAAFAVAKALLGCAVEDAELWPGPVVLSPAHAEDRTWAEGLLQRDCEVVPQPQGNLGEKLQWVDRSLRQSGHSKVVFIGTDAPEHTPQHYAEVCRLLAAEQVVLTPADDGGVTVMASVTGWPDLKDLPWSQEQLGDCLANSCKAAGMSVALSDGCWDVDEESDLRRLVSSLEDDARPARQQLLKVVRSVLDRS